MQEVQTCKKLTLKKETLKTLTDKQLEQVAGAALPQSWGDCSADNAGTCYC